ncbi:hypothetical protein [Acidisphaera sp. S103]|uniref:DUF3024 domain-containing protein n=1 Tax=Acidisphaera sp. S103 TaxID=1747223 RepID=UPI001C20306C|nr:hypothetical protein [Acidisphaera sp. S103]
MARSRRGVWAPVPPKPVSPDAAEKQAIIDTCETFIATVLKPRFLPSIKPTEFNYMVDIRGEWRAGRYRFMRRYRSGFPETAGMEFDASFARIDRMGPDQFDIYWMRHTGTWYQLHTGKTFAETLHILETDGILFPY